MEEKTKMKSQDKALIIFAIFVVAGYSYNFDMPQALEDPLREEPYSFTSLQFNILYLATSLPIIFTDIPIGVLLDRLPIQKTLTFITLCSCIATTSFALLLNFTPPGYKYLLYFCRGIMGMAGSSAFTIQGMITTTYAASYYETILGLCLLIPFVFDSINLYAAPAIVDSTHSMGLPCFIGAFIDLIAFAFSLIIAAIVIKKIQKDQSQHNIQSEKLEETKEKKQQENKQEKTKEKEHSISISYLKEMPKIFWIIQITIFFTEYIASGIFSNLNDLIVNRFKFDYVFTGELLIIPYLVASILSIAFGRTLTTHPTFRRKIIFLSSIIYTIGLGILAFLPNNGTSDQINWVDYLIVTLFLFGLAVNQGVQYSCLTSCIVILIDPKRLGTAWGVVGASISLARTLAPIMNGLIEDIDSNLGVSYKYLTFCYFCISFIVVAFSSWIFYGDNAMIDKNFAQASRELKEKQQQKLKESLVTGSEISVDF